MGTTTIYFYGHTWATLIQRPVARWQALRQPEGLVESRLSQQALSPRMPAAEEVPVGEGGTPG